jgi:hypothetical protein
MHRTGPEHQGACARRGVQVSSTRTHSGWVLKQGERRKNWKRRWFQLQLEGREIAYYDRPGGDCKGEIDLKGCERVSSLGAPSLRQRPLSNRR